MAKASVRKKASTKASGGVIIRRAKKEDVPAIVAMNAELLRFHEPLDKSFGIAVSDRALRRILMKHKADRVATRCVRLAVAEYSGKVVGYCFSFATTRLPVGQTRRAVHVQDMCVAARCRRRGIGRALFDDVAHWARSRGITRIEVAFAPANKLSSSFWQGLGFRTYLIDAYLDI